MTPWIPRSQARTEEEERDAYAAPVQDPLWMLGRQLQTGGWVAGDGGTVVEAELSYTVAPVRYKGEVLDGPIEPQIEAEPLPLPEQADGRTRARWGAELVRLLRRAGSLEAAAALTWARPYVAPGPGAASARFGHRVPDPVSVRALLDASMGPDRSGALPDLPGLSHTPAVHKACRTWLQRMDARIGTGGPAEPTPTWRPERLEYHFSLATATPHAPVELTATDYDGTGVDWHTFDRAPTTALPQNQPVEVRRVRPTPIEYRGMPLPRYWAFEDGDVDLDLLDDDTSLPRALLRTFALRFGGDWHIVPLPVPAGALQVTALRLIDTFGDHVDVTDVAEIDDGGGPWHFLELHRNGDEPGDVTRAVAGLRVLLPPSPPPLQGPVLEDVLLARDEIANLAWVIERHTLDTDGSPVDRHRRHLQRRPPTDPTYAPSRRTSAATYRLATALPDYWYPLMPTQTADGHASLTLAEIPAEARHVDDTDVRGTLVPHLPHTWFFDEEVPGEGAQVIRRDRLLPGPVAAIVWRARIKKPGTGGASSGLQFDALL